jgi:fatty acyl-CoA reductase
VVEVEVTVMVKFTLSFLVAVTPAFKEPIPGWVDSLNGPIGLLVGGGKGVIRSLHCKGEYQAEVVPVDIAINGLIIIAWRTGTSASR